MDTHHLITIPFGLTAIEFGLILILALFGLFFGRTARIISSATLLFLTVVWFPHVFLKIGFFAALIVVISELLSYFLEKLRAHIRKLFSKPVPIALAIIGGVIIGFGFYLTFGGIILSAIIYLR